MVIPHPKKVWIIYYGNITMKFKPSKFTVTRLFKPLVESLHQRCFVVETTLKKRPNFYSNGYTQVLQSDSKLFVSVENLVLIKMNRVLNNCITAQARTKPSSTFPLNMRLVKRR